MSKAEILKELPALQPADRREIFDRLCDLQERDLLAGQPPTPEEKALLDRELEDYRKNPDAEAQWHEVIDRRSREIEEGKVACRPVDEVVEDIRAKLNAHRQPS